MPFSVHQRESVDCGSPSAENRDLSDCDLFHGSAYIGSGFLSFFISMRSYILSSVLLLLQCQHFFCLSSKLMYKKWISVQLNFFMEKDKLSVAHISTHTVEEILSPSFNLVKRRDLACTLVELGPVVDIWGGGL